uniref:Uncharacterized protein n=1 Tax=Candidatus Methanophaga sp. ANME-1 ERB7 TaxID=2759913 RepID=A0A7G9ZCV5_9EURY|nr:hypothetical protein OJKMNAAM_00011 [Methanosarcinales archaeon ANME-1 ERB7]
MLFKIKKENEGPFRANRILDTPEVKVDQVFTKEEKPVALFATIAEDEAKKIGAEGYFGPTQMGVEGKYERDKKWVTKSLYFYKNIPDAYDDENLHRQIRESLRTEGTIVPSNMQFEKVENISTILLSGTASLEANYDGSAKLNGSLNVSTPSAVSAQIMKRCPYCNSEIEVTSNICPVCKSSIES